MFREVKKKKKTKAEEECDDKTTTIERTLSLTWKLHEENIEILWRKKKKKSLGKRLTGKRLVCAKTEATDSDHCNQQLVI